MPHRSRALAVLGLAVAMAAVLVSADVSPASAGLPGYGNTYGEPTADAPGRPATYPSIREWQAARGDWSLTRRSRIVVTGPDQRGVAALFAQDLAVLTGIRVPVVASGSAGAHDIVLALDAGDARLGGEGYRLDVGNTLAVHANARSGLLYGTQTILQIIKSDPRRRHVPHGTATDWPTTAQRGQMIDLGRKYYPIDYLKSQIRQMAWLKLNMLHLHLTDWNGFRFASTAYPTLASPQHYSLEQLRDLDQYAASYGVTIVPEIDLPGHASWLTRWDPSLALSCPSMSVTHWPGGSLGGWMIDVTSPKARTVVKTLITELASTFSGGYVHIGGDEIAYDAAKDNCPQLVDWSRAHGYQYPGDAIVDFINDLNRTVRDLGKTAELWHWWDFNGQKTSIAPSKDIRVDMWLEGPENKASQGYHTIGTEEKFLYVSPGYGTTPGQYGYMPAEQVYQSYPFATGPNIEGHKISRWSDKAENKPVSWFDFFAQRPLKVLAERTWGGPRSTTATGFYERADSIGDAPPDQLTAVPRSRYRVLAVSSQETQAENGSATNAFDGDPLTTWSSRYTSLAPVGPQHLTIDLGNTYPVAGVRVEPRQNGKTVANLYDTLGRIKDYTIEVSPNGTTWRTVSSGTLPDEQPASTLTFPTTSAKYVRITGRSDWASVFVTAIAELTVLRAPEVSVQPVE